MMNRNRRYVGIMTAIMMALIACTAQADAVSGNVATDSQVYLRSDSSYYINLTVPVQVVPVYCFYSAYMQDYLWTCSEEEKALLTQKYLDGSETYAYQGISGYVEKEQTAASVPVYRFWNKVTTDHFYTISEAEKLQVEEDFRTGKDNYQYEGIAFYTPLTSDCPAYRFFDTVAFNHYYTSDDSIKASLQADYLNGIGNYRYEGIAWYWYR